MKLFRVRFTTDFGMTSFGEVADIIEASRVISLNLKLYSGGWNRGEPTTCYHVWVTEADPEMVKNFILERYGKSLIEIRIDNMNSTSLSSPDQDIQS
jgi:hypothetical protein